MPSSHTRYVKIVKESSSDYNPSSSPSGGVVGEVESESFQQSFDVLKRNDMNYQGAAKAIVSKKTAEGSISMALQPDAFVFTCLHGIMGEDVEGADAAAERTFAELDVNEEGELPSYTFKIGRDEKEHVFGGQVIESISVSASVGEYAMMTVNTVGAGQKSSTETLSTSVPTYTGDAAHFAKSYVRFEAAATNAAHSNLVQSIDFEIKSNRDIENSYSLASETCIRAPPTTTREISGSLTFHKSLLTGDVADNEIYFDEIMGATAANGQALVNPSSTTPAISVLFEVDSTNFIRFDFFKVHFEMPETSVSGRDSQTMTVNFHALYDLGQANKMMQIVCRGADSSIVANYDA